jgi:hypothetical protein
MGRRWKPLARQAIEYILVEVLELIATRGSPGNGAGDETRTRDIQLGRKDATAQAVRVFKKALDASMAHFLWLANVFL